MATFHTLGIADPPLEDVPGAHCLTVFTQGNVAASRKSLSLRKQSDVYRLGHSFRRVAQLLVSPSQSVTCWGAGRNKVQTGT